MSNNQPSLDSILNATSSSNTASDEPTTRTGWQSKSHQSLPPVPASTDFVSPMAEAKQTDGKVPAAPLDEPASGCGWKKAVLCVVAALCAVVCVVAAVHYLANLGKEQPVPTMPRITPNASAVGAAGIRAMARQPRGIDYSRCTWQELEATPDGRSFWATTPCARFIY